MNPISPRSRGRALVECACAAAVSLIAAVVLLRLWNADLRVPFDYHDDALYFGMLVKSVVGRGWFFTNAQLGAPGVLTLYDFPGADGFHLLVIKVMSLFSSDWALLFNVYFLLGFPLIAISALVVLRHFRVGFGPALAASVLFAFLPKRLLTGEMHYFLSLYYQVPLAVLVALWVCGDDPPLVGARGSLRRGRSLAAMAICLLVSATGIYYAFFGGALILLGGIWASLTRRRRQNALAGAILAAIIVAGLAVQAAPTLAYHHRHGENPEVAFRHPGESEVFGLRIAQLLLPVPGHRVPALRRVRGLYDATAPFPGEGSTTALGLAGSFGFLALLAFALLRPSPTRPDAGLVRSLAVLNLLAVLLATTGGFGSLFALLVTPEIRAYARMQVFVAFFALSAVALLLDQQTRREGRRAWFGAILPPIVLVLGLLDQVTPLAVRPYREIRAQYAADEGFVRHVEANVPERAMIFELPYQTFPEAGPGASRREVRYEPLRPYFHSGRLRWSYPAMLGRTADAFARSVSASPPAEMVRRLLEGGFAGIVIDRRGYDDDAEALGAALEREVGAPAMFSDDGRVIFLDLTALNGRVFAGASPVERERRRDLAVHPLFLRWLDGFYEAEVGPDGTLRWCSGTGKIEIDNEAGSARRARITLNLATPLRPSRLAISGDLWSDHVDVEPVGTLFSQTVVLSPGRHFVRLSSKGPLADAPSDPRRLVWRVDGATIEELSD